jgi:hypothetical protein
MGRATDAYRTALSTAGAGLTAHSKNFKKGQMTFVFRVPRDGGMERVATAVQQLPEDLRGTPDWPD